MNGTTRYIIQVFKVHNVVWVIIDPLVKQYKFVEWISYSIPKAYHPSQKE